jgi:hypothetical protein
MVAAAWNALQRVGIGLDAIIRIFQRNEWWARLHEHGNADAFLQVVVNRFAAAGIAIRSTDFVRGLECPHFWRHTRALLTAPLCIWEQAAAAAEHADELFGTLFFFEAIIAVIEHLERSAV